MKIQKSICKWGYPLTHNRVTSNPISKNEIERERERDNMSRLIVTIQHPPPNQKAWSHMTYQNDKEVIVQKRKKNKKKSETYSPQRQNRNLSCYNQPDPAIADEVQSSTDKESTPDG